MKKLLLLFALMLTGVGAWAQVVTDGVYIIKNTIQNRGTMCYGTKNGTAYFGLGSVTLSGYTGNSLDVSNVADSCWYVKTVNNKTFIYNIGQGKFVQNSSSVEVANFDAKASGFDLKSQTISEKNYIKVMSGKKYLTFACGWAPNEGQIRLVEKDENDAVALNFVLVENGTETYSTQITAANAAIDAYHFRPTTGKFYRIKGIDGTKPYVGFELIPNVDNASKSSLSVVATADSAGIYYLEEIEGSATKGRLVNLETGKYLCMDGTTKLNNTGSDVEFFIEKDDPLRFEVKVGGNFIFNNNTGHGYLHEGGRNAVNEKFFTFEEVSALPVKVSDAKYATFYAPVAVTLPETDLTAYYVTAATDETATLTKIDGVIPANTGVILNGEAGTYSLEIGGEGSVEGNKLSGTTKPTMVDVEAYVLARDNEITGFYKAEMNQNSGAAFLNNAFKAYLPASAVPAAASARLLFDFGTETAIETIESAEGANAVIYDLAGRRVQSAQKGLYIVNGKKVIK